MKIEVKPICENIQTGFFYNKPLSAKHKIIRKMRYLKDIKIVNGLAEYIFKVKKMAAPGRHIKQFNVL